MADLEAVLADVSYLLAMEKSRSTNTKSTKFINLPDSSVRVIMMKYLQKLDKLNFESIFDQLIGYRLFKEFCEHLPEGCATELQFFYAIREFEQLNSIEDRVCEAKKIYDKFIMQDLLCQNHGYSRESVDFVQENLVKATKTGELSTDLFKLSLNDFSLHRIIGRGGFGEVYGCRKLDTGRMYAMKCLDKKRIKLKGSVRLVLNERSMLYRVSSGTISKLCFILDLMNGGDLHYHLTQHNVFNETEVRFYGAEILLGLEHLHKRSIVYRDLKPANILLDEWGHVKISDLGLACDFSRRLPTAGVGTHGYMAPEVLKKNVAYNHSADFFSFGCFLYKLVCGHSPFKQNKIRTKNDIDKLTLNMNTIEFSVSVSPDFKNLITSLLNSEPETRLGCDSRGIDGVKIHSFFDGVDWKAVYARRYSPPLIPSQGEVNAADAFEIGMFDDQDIQNIKLTQADQEQYANFQLVISDRWQKEIMNTFFDSINEIEEKRDQKRLAQIEIKINSANSSVSAGLSQSTSPSRLSFDGKTKAIAIVAPSARREDNLNSNFSPDSDLIFPNNTIINSWPIDLLVEWWLAPDLFGVGSSDCIVEGELLRLGGPFMQNWQKKHIRLFPNRIEMYNKTREGIPLKSVELFPLTDIRTIASEFQKIAKQDHVITIMLKNETKIFLTSNEYMIAEQWLEEMLTGLKKSEQLMLNMNKKLQWVYGIEEKKGGTIEPS